MHEECRICLGEAPSLGYISVLNNLNHEKSVLQGIIECSSIEILAKDPLPQTICNECFTKLDNLYIFRKLILTSDTILKEKLFYHIKLPLIGENKNDVKWEEKCEDTSEKYLENDNFECNDDTQSVKSEEIRDSVESCTEIKIKKQFRTKQKTPRKNPKISALKEPNIIRKAKSKQGKLNRIHECKECEKTFNKADHLRVHMAYKHWEKKFKCKFCDKKFARIYDLVYHKRVHTGEKPFHCDICNKSYASSSYFYMHKRIHTGEKRFKCEFCKDGYINSDQLQIHIRQKHTGEKPFLCEMCSSAFTSSSALARHKRDVHEKKEQCLICNKMFSGRVLKDHVRRHKERDEGIKRYTCELCGKKFTCATSRKRHLVIHSGEKAYKCEVCGKAFNQRSTLQTHMKVHSEVMPFLCEFCDKSFRYKHHLKAHFENHHKDAERDRHAEGSRLMFHDNNVNIEVAVDELDSGGGSFTLKVDSNG